MVDGCFVANLIRSTDLVLLCQFYLFICFNLCNLIIAAIRCYVLKKDTLLYCKLVCSIAVSVVEMHLVSSIGDSKAGLNTKFFHIITNSGNRLTPTHPPHNYVQILHLNDW